MYFLIEYSNEKYFFEKEYTKETPFWKVRGSEKLEGFFNFLISLKDKYKEKIEVILF